MLTSMLKNICLWKLDNWVRIWFRSNILQHFSKSELEKYHISSLPSIVYLFFLTWRVESTPPDVHRLRPHGGGEIPEDREDHQLLPWCVSSHGQTTGIGTIWPRKNNRTERKSWKGDFVQTKTIKVEGGSYSFPSELRGDRRDVYVCDTGGEAIIY